MSQNPLMVSSVLPRSVPLVARMRLLAGSMLTLIFWGVFAFTMIFIWGFSVDKSVAELWRFSGPLETMAGVVTGHRELSIHINKSAVVLTEYRFIVDNTTFTGGSCETGRHLETGASVTVEFPKGDPSYSRIRGMRATPMGASALFMLAFPLVPIPFLVYGFVRGRRHIGLLREGVVGRARLRSKRPTNVRVNRQPVFEYIFEFTAADGQVHEVVARAYQPGKFQDEKEEPVLYDPMEPSRAALLDALPGEPHFDEMGGIRMRSPVGSLLGGLVPVAVLLVHGAVALHRWFGN